MRPNLSSLASRIRSMEHKGGYVVLVDGTKFKPEDGILMLFDAVKMRDELGRKPELSDFPEKDRKAWQNFARWNPEAGNHGQISILVSRMAKKLIS